jgi:hypothetical protein
MKNLVFLLLILPLPLSAQAAELCVPLLDKSHPRKVDIQFPGKLISVVGHQHPDREMNVELIDLENYLSSLLGGYVPWGTSAQRAAIKKQLDFFLERDAKAIAHWQLDLHTLEQGLKAGKYAHSFIEYASEDLARMAKMASTYFANGNKILPQLGYDEEETRKILTMGLTPAFYVKQRDPALFGEMKILTAEPSEKEEEAYERAHCSGRKPPQERNPALEALLQRLQKQSPPKERKSIAAQFAAGVKAAEELMVQRLIDEAPVTAEEAGKAFLKASKLRVEAEEAKLLSEALEARLEHLREELKPRADLSPEEIERAIQRFRGCDGRDGAMAQNLAKAPGSSILFVGAGHLPAQAALLARECKKLTR